MQVRPVIPADAPAVHRVSAESVTAAYEGLDIDPAIIDQVTDPDFQADLREWFEQLDGRDDVVYLVAERDVGVVGFAQFCWGDVVDEDFVDSGDILLQSLYVMPGHWGEGVGTSLLEEGVDRLPPDATRLVLGVLPENEIGWSFYDSRGFEKVGESTYEVNDGRYETDVLARPL